METMMKRVVLSPRLGVIAGHKADTQLTRKTFHTSSAPSRITVQAVLVLRVGVCAYCCAFISLFVPWQGLLMLPSCRQRYWNFSNEHTQSTATYRNRQSSRKMATVMQMVWSGCDSLQYFVHTSKYW